MLVLTRRHKEKVVFPNLGITIELLRSNGRVAQLGIDAPRDIKVLREEVHQREYGGEFQSADRSGEHELRNKLNSLSLSLQVMQKRLSHGMSDGIETSLESVIEQLKTLDNDIRTAVPPPIESKPTSDLPLRPGRSALLVDDSVNERTLLAELLQLNGFDVFAVPDGQQALDFLRNGRRLPDFVLLDMRMPNMNGVETVAEIRSDHGLSSAGFKLFAVSGADRDDLQIEEGPRGVDRWFSKPVDVKLLLKEMKSELQIA